MTHLKSSWLETPLGSMIAIGDDEHLYLLEFLDRKGLDSYIDKLCKRKSIDVTAGRTHVINTVEKELNRYFEGTLDKFMTPLQPLGSPFQKSVWDELQRIPSGITRSYLDVAKRIGNPKGYRAVANANGANNIAIIIPCHRVINANGELGGYGGGIKKKKWLLEHERAHYG